MIINVGLEDWILADGSYDDFSVEQERKFALKFYPQPELAPSAEGGVPRLEPRKDCLYLARGKVVYWAPRAVAPPLGIWVCDFGVLAYSDHDVPEWAHVGAGVAGEIYLGIDYYAYFEVHHKLPKIPKLTYRVRIRRIWLEETPMVADPEGEYAAIPDVSRTQVREVDTTDLSRAAPSVLWNLGSSAGPPPQNHFVLECEILESGVSPVGGRG